VFDQDPPGASRADEGATVRIIVSSGVGQAEVPIVVGFTEQQARSLLENAGFGTQVEPVTDDAAPEGPVLRPDPRGKSMADRGSTVKITISAGEEQVAVPDVRGQTETTAANELGRRGFATQVRSESSETVGRGLVIRTDPPAGE